MIFLAAFAALTILYLIELRLRLIDPLVGTSFGAFLSKDATYRVFSGILISTLAAYIFYLVIEVIPRNRHEKGVFKALNRLIASILDSYDKKNMFGHEAPISSVDLGVLDKEWLSNTKSVLEERKSEFLKLKYAMETAHTRLDDFRHALPMAVSVSPEFAVMWLQLTDSVRLIAEEYGKQPPVPLEKIHLLEVDNEDNPVYLYRLTLIQRLHQFINDAEAWLKAQHGLQSNARDKRVIATLNYLRSNMEAETPLNQKIRNLFKTDPKPIFDHFRNIGIAAALALGAGALRSFNLENNPGYLNDIALVCSYVAFTIATVLLIINTSFAQTSINLFFFNKTKFNGFFQKLISAIALYSYIGVLVALTVMYAFNAANDRMERRNQQQAAAEKLYLNIEKVNETLERLGEENIKLRSVNSKLKDKNENLSTEVSQFNKSIQPTAGASAD